MQGKACAIGAILLLSYWFASAAHAEPYKPLTDDVVLLTFDKPTRRPLAALRTTDELFDAAQTEIASGRATLDERAFGRAEAMLLKALPCLRKPDECGRDERTTQILTSYADVLQHRHDFASAERILDVVLRSSGHAARAHLMRASIRIAQGRVREATQDCSSLIGRTDVVVATACLAQALSLNGRLSEAHALLAGVLEGARGRNEQYAWAFGILAELAERRGSSQEAVAHIETALLQAPGSAALRLQAVDLLLRAKRPERALDLLGGLSVSEPVLLRQAIAARQLHLPQAAQYEGEWRQSREQAEQLKLPRHERDVAVGELEIMGRPDRALRHATDNWQTTHEIDDARVLLRAAVAAGRLDAARPALDWIEQHAVEDAVFREMRRGAAL